MSNFVGSVKRTGSAEDSGDLDELDGLLGGVHCCDLKDGKLDGKMRVGSGVSPYCREIGGLGGGRGREL